MSRVKETQVLIKDIRSLTDNNVTNIYDKVWTSCEATGAKKTSRVQKITYITKNLDLIQDDVLIEIKKIIDDVHKYDKIYDVLLNILNLILKHIDALPITDITQFQNVSKNDIISEECNKIVLDFIEKLIETGFDRKIVGYQKYKNTVFANIHFINKLCKQIGYDFVFIRKSRQDGTVRTITLLYSIKKIM